MPIYNDIKKSDLAHGLKEYDLQLLAGIAEEQEYFKDAVIFHENDAVDCFHLLLEGKVAIERRFLSGKNIARTLIQNVKQGQLIGEMGYIEEGRTRSATAMAKSRVRLATVEFAKLDALIQQHPGFGVRLLRNIAVILSRRLRRMNEQWLRGLLEETVYHEFDYL